MTNSFIHAGQTTAAATPVSRADREFARARRHTRTVRLLKVGLPIVAGLMVLAGLGAAFVARSLPGDLSFAATSIENGRLVMQDPRLSGSDSSDRPYSMVARRAIQAATGTGVDLEAIRADVAVDGQTNAVITAGNGFYDHSTQRLRLYDEISVRTTSDVEIRLSEADIDLVGRQMVGQGTVTITTPNQRLESGSVSIADGGSRLTFGDRVKLTLLPNSTEETESE